MHVQKETILAVAKAAHLELTEKEVQQYLQDFQNILEAFSQLKEVDTNNTTPAFHPVPLADNTREDVSKEGCTQEEALKLSKHTSNGFFIAPKIL